MARSKTCRWWRRVYLKFEDKLNETCSVKYDSDEKFVESSISKIFSLNYV